MNVPPKFLQDQRRRSLPIFVEVIEQSSCSYRCKNCGDRGFITAFYADHNLSARVGAPPPAPKGRVLSFINNGWWIEHQTETCPDCKGDPSRNRQPAYIKRPEVLNELTAKLHTMQDQRKPQTRTEV